MKQTYTPKEKAKIVKAHFMEDVPIDTLCQRYKINPSEFEKWKKNLYENSDLIFK